MPFPHVLSFYIIENGKGSQASSENQAAQKDPQNDELDNTNPGTLVFVLFLLLFLFSSYP